MKLLLKLQLKNQDLTWETLSGRVSVERSTDWKKTPESEKMREEWKRRKGAEWRYGFEM